MNKSALPWVFAGLALSAAATAGADVQVTVGLNPFVFGGYPPPVVYRPAPYYSPPPVVYLGGGSWGDPRRGHQPDRRDRGHEKDRPDHDK
jgi:hypothetical protein